jgi:Ca2+-transporting ATPase
LTVTEWHESEVSDVCRHLKADRIAGLDDAEAERRLEQYGPNELIEAGGRGIWRILWEQLSGAMVVLLIVAAAVSLYLGELTDSIAILTIVVLNAVLGFVQDFRAERAIAALKRLAVPNVTVRRGGHVQEVSARDLVPGDLLVIEVGNIVPADCRVVEAANLRIQEAALTGESEPVDKQVEPLTAGHVSLGDRTNMLFMGTIVTYGHGEALVTETGMKTELGCIAGMLQTVRREPTPLQRRLAALGRGLAVAALLIVAIVFALGVLRGEEAKLMFMTALSMAVAAVPEGLPAVATVALAIGASRMLKRRALIRKLPAVETLGSVTVICSDKTGTLTENRMTVEILEFAGDRMDVTEHLDHGEPALGPADERLQLIKDRPALALLVAGGGLCNDAMLEPDAGRPGYFHAVGDPTEGALVVVAARVGMNKPDLERALQRVGEFPFDSSRKRMTTVHRRSHAGGLPAPLREALASVAEMRKWRYVAVTKGAVDSVLEIADYVWDGDHAVALDDDWRERIDRAHDQMAGRGMRVLGIAFRKLESAPTNVAFRSAEQELIFIGMVGIIDPPRPEVKEAVERCKTAGIRPVMITGDHPLTALHIAGQLGIDSDDRALTGHELANMTVKDLEPIVEAVSVYARVSPEDKLKIVQALQNKGHIVAMTGDGVNDAPALKKADIGVAMGITGTDVAKEASETVLLDDNFATIVGAVEEGRIIFDNIRKFIKYTMTSNAGEIWVMLLAPLVGMPLPLLPLQILWINLVTDGLPGLALAVEPAERNTMRRPPYPPKTSIIDRLMAIDIVWIGLLMGVVSLGVGFFYFDPLAATDARWRTMIFTVLTLAQMGNAVALRSARDSVFSIGLLSNKALLGSVLLTFTLQMAVVYLPALQDIFKTTSLSALDLAVCLVLSTVVFWAVEVRKWVARRG